MKEATRKRILYLHSRGLSQFGISQKLKVKPWIAKQIIEAELQRDYDSLFNQ